MKVEAFVVEGVVFSIIVAKQLQVSYFTLIPRPNYSHIKPNILSPHKKVSTIYWA